VVTGTSWHLAHTTSPKLFHRTLFLSAYIPDLNAQMLSGSRFALHSVTLSQVKVGDLLCRRGSISSTICQVMVGRLLHSS
jgi:hypothetical protein